jgi:hypothetical protein
MVKMDEFLATRMFFWGPNFAKNRPEVKKIAFWQNFASKKNLDASLRVVSRGSMDILPAFNISQTLMPASGWFPLVLWTSYLPSISHN